MSATYAPKPGAAAPGRMVLAQAALELRLLLRHGEQLVLTMVIPLLLLVGLATTSVVDVAVPAGFRRVDVATPGVIALAVLSTAFTGLAIATGFERRYGVLKRLGTTPLSRPGLLAGKTIAVIGVELVQLVVIAAVALALGWSPQGSPLAVLALLLAGTAACSGLGLLMAGTLRAEATLAAANLMYVLMLLAGAALVPVERYPESVRPFVEATPLGALATGLRDVLMGAAGMPWAALGVLLAWAVGSLGLAAATFRWE
jgi:ABC-2 type transport system permease protein